jgi:pantetheine-phosphate adenylyltransferase
MAIAVYPGTFDPLTRGHEDLVRRAARMFDRVVVGISDSRAKTFFDQAERIALAREVLAGHANVEVAGFSGLLRDFVRSLNANVIVRGVRSVADFEYEQQLAGMNRHLMDDVDTIFMTPADQYQFVSGTLVREIALYGGGIGKFVFPCVEAAMRRKLDERTGAPPAP